MKPPSNGHFWTNINSNGFPPVYIEVVLKRFQLHYIDRAGDKIWGFIFVHCGEEYNTLSLYRRVLFERFHCNVLNGKNISIFFLCSAKLLV